MHEFQWFLVCVLEYYLCSGLISVVLVFVWSSSLVKPISVLMVAVLVLKTIISLVKPVTLLITTVSTIFSAEVLSGLVVTQVPIVFSEIWSRIE